MGTTAVNVEPQTTSTNAVASMSPNAFRGACVNLLCKLENKLAQMGESGTSGATFEKLETAKLMLVDLVDFAEDALQAKQVEMLTPHIQEVYEKCKSLEENMHKTSWSIMQRFGRDKPSRFEIDSAYEELSKDYVSLFVVFFVESMKGIGVPTAEKRELLESLEAFVDEVRRRW